MPRLKFVRNFGVAHEGHAGQRVEVTSLLARAGGGPVTALSRDLRGLQNRDVADKFTGLLRRGPDVVAALAGVVVHVRNLAGSFEELRRGTGADRAGLDRHRGARAYLLDAPVAVSFGTGALARARGRAMTTP